MSITIEDLKEVDRRKMDAARREAVRNEREVQERVRAYAQVEGLHSPEAQTVIPLGNPEGADDLWALARSLDGFDKLEITHDFQGNCLVVRRTRRMLEVD